MIYPIPIIPQQTQPAPLSFNPAAYPQRVPIDPYAGANSNLSDLAAYVSQLPAQNALIGHTEAETEQMKAYTRRNFGSDAAPAGFSTGTPTPTGISPTASLPASMQSPPPIGQSPSWNPQPPSQLAGGGALQPSGGPGSPQGQPYDHYSAFQKFKAQARGGGSGAQPQAPSGGVQWGGTPTEDDPAGIGASLTTLGTQKYQLLSGALQAAAQRRTFGKMVSGSPLLKSLLPGDMTAQEAENLDPAVFENAVKLATARAYSEGKLGLEGQKVLIQKQNADTSAGRLTQSTAQNLTSERSRLVTTNAALVRQLPPKMQGVIDSLGLDQIPGLGLSQAQQAAMTQYKQNQNRMQEIDSQLQTMPGQPKPPAGAPASTPPTNYGAAIAYLQKNFPNHPLTAANLQWAMQKLNGANR